MPRLFRLLSRTLFRLTLPVFGMVLLYACMAVVLGLLPGNRSWKSPTDGITVWLTTNGVHAALILPRQNRQMDWTPIFAPAHTRTGKLDPNWDTVSFGWGDRKFFLETPTWADLSASTAIYALSGLDHAVMHVDYDAAPPDDPDTIALKLSPEAYARLVAYIRGSLQTDTHGQPEWIEGHSYGRSDAFYEARGRYSLLHTCNQWVRDALAAAGTRVPLWSPFDKALFWQLREASH